MHIGYVWNTHGVGSIDALVTVLKQRLTDFRWQCLGFHIQISERFPFYKNTHTIKTWYKMEPYLLSNLYRIVKCVLRRFRLGMSDIFAQSMR